MTEEEKESIRQNLMAFSVKNTAQDETLYFKTPSPYFSKFSFMYFAKATGAFVIIATVSIAGLSYASASALPGEPLYAIKINLKEKIEDQLTFSSEKKIALSQQRIQVRFSEAKTLIKEKKITSETLSIVEAKVQEDKVKIADALEKINKENPEALTIAKTDLDASIEENKDKINTLIDESNIKDVTGEDIHYGETDADTIEGGEVIPNPTEETPKDTTTAPDISTDTSVIQDLKVIPDLGDAPIPPLEKIDGIDTDTN